MFQGTFAACLLYPPAIVIFIWGIVAFGTAMRRMLRAGDKADALLLSVALVLPLSDATIGNVFGGLVEAALFAGLAWRAWRRRPGEASAVKWAFVALAMVCWIGAAFYEMDNASQSRGWRFDLILLAPLLWASSLLAVLALQRWITPTVPRPGGTLSEPL